MKLPILLLLFGFVFIPLQSQENGLKHFYVTIAEANSLTVHRKNDFVLISNEKNSTETSIYKKYTIVEFKIAYPNTDNKQLKNVYHITTKNPNLLKELSTKYPKKYTRIIEFFPAPGAFYPNDYGNSSPVKNLGNTYSSRDLDLINAAGAWGITQGNEKVIIGISDTPIDTLNPDLKGKIIKNLYVSEIRRAGDCYHGTNVAAIAFATMDNEFGRPGICSDCKGISGRYGSFKHIEELVEAGAKVINASWVLCRMGPKTEEINARINEYYEDGIIIVAAAGNGRKCSKEQSTIGAEMFPASFDKVISVSGVFSENQIVQDGFFSKDNINYTHRLMDRRNGFFTINEAGLLIPSSIEKGVQVNSAVDIMAPIEGYLLGNEICGKNNFYGGATSASAPYVTGTIGLMWSANYCLSSYEIESILKLTSVEIENLSGNTFFRGMLGAGRLDAYKAVKMANDMKDLNGNVLISDRDFYRFDFKIERALNTIIIQNQTFRENASVDFKAKKAIILKPNTHLKPNDSTQMKLAISPNISTAECELKPPKKYKRIIE